MAEAVHACQSVFYWMTIKATLVGSASRCQSYEILRGIVALQDG